MYKLRISLPHKCLYYFKPNAVSGQWVHRGLFIMVCFVIGRFMYTKELPLQKVIYFIKFLFGSAQNHFEPSERLL